MPVAYHFTNWWFWALLPVIVPLMFALDRALSGYSSRYWLKRGYPQPPHRNSYLDAGRFVIYAACSALAAVWSLANGAYAAAGVFCLITAAFGWLARYQARRNVI